MNDSFAAVALYAGLNAILLVILSINAGIRRSGPNIQPGTFGEGALTRAIRAHGNFTENAPLALLLLVALALTNTAALPIHVLGATFTFGRVIQAIGMMRAKHPNVIRFIGNILTWLVLLGGGALCVLRFIEATGLMA
ncbi:MAG: MAPEG family protein, partial [Terricaulis sp.]